jgi:hypothetical protein
MIPLARMLEIDGQQPIAPSNEGPELLMEMLECRSRC